MRIKGSAPDEWNFIVPVSNGVLRPPHVEKIGPALVLFLCFEDMVTAADGDTGFGLVLGGRPVTDAEIGSRLGLHPKTVGEHRTRLQEHGYITTERKARGMIVRVRRSKKVFLLRSRARADGSSDKPQIPPPLECQLCNGTGWVGKPVRRCGCRKAKS